MYLPVLDGYRAASIIFVLCGHLLPLGPKAWRLNESAAALGMTMFFSLSGFLIASQLLNDQNVGRFLIRRAARIWPLVLAYTTIVYFIVQTDADKFLFTNLFAVNYLRQYLDGWNGHLWSLCVEVQFYAAIALAVAVGGRAATWTIWPACLLVTIMRVVSAAEISILTHLRVDEILVGACVATLQLDRSNRSAPPWLFLVALLATLATCLPAAGPLQYLRPYLTALLLVIAIRQEPRRWLELLMTSRPAKYVADVSYALYVIHPAFTHGWFAGDGAFDKYAIKRPISLALTFALAHLSTFYWEKPWMQLAKVLSQRRKPKSAD
jgi:peptidoglycan/LPS O-acetylase OafA/YrhL